MSRVFTINMNFRTYFLLFAIWANFSTNANGDSNIQQTTRVSNEISEEESAELFPAVLQDNYRNGFYQLLEFFQTTNSTLTKLREKLDGLENKIEVLNTHLLKTARETKANTDSLKQEIASFKKSLSNARAVHSEQIQSLKSQTVNLKSEQDAKVNVLFSSLSSKLDGLERTQNLIQSSIRSQAATISSLQSNDRTVHSQQIQSLKSQIESKLDGLERTQNLFQSSIRSQDDTISSLQSKNSKMAAALFERNPEAFLDFLPSPRTGKSFNGLTFEAISAAVPTDNMLVAQIKNYMDVDLTGYQLHLPYGFVVSPAPNKISAKTAEVATFEANEKLNDAAQPEMSYRIGDTDISLHVYFIRGWIYQTFAAALLQWSAPANSIISIDCTRYNHRGTAGLHKCVTNVGKDSTRTLTVYEGDIFLKVTFETKSYPRPATLTCEVFKLSL